MSNDLKITTRIVDDYSAKYGRGPANERRLFEEVGPRVADRGFYERDEFLEVVRWKNNRGLGHAEANTAAEIQEASRLALWASDPWSWRILTLLSGVGTAVASALLTVASPDRYTVIDRRAVGTLRTAERLGDDWPSYNRYLELCRGIADDVGVSLRTLDRALWKYSQIHLDLDGTQKNT